ncbi:DUF1240 domain-containing protein [Proteus mirabilis]|nr:DUF1240 domain-containing protein [Proteus mirabilis]KAB7723227.1 DUF1240 domain-containing protein [Proteus mirabilis]MBN7158966.1 DUF1240 domain-containing protein [Proteus mirabilis]MBN7225487.1 DUF1240 domain-containing protein [Proteus mirabilis]MBN7245888.1 DUF1240 domain-containing protein [Proteus mirabilis]
MHAFTLYSPQNYSCDKPSIFAPNKYVVSKVMCK